MPQPETTPVASTLATPPAPARRATRARALALAAAAATVIVAVALARHRAPGEASDPAEPFFQSQAVSSDRDSTAKPLATARTTSATARTAAAATKPAAPAPAATPPIASKRAVGEPPTKTPAKRTTSPASASSQPIPAPTPAVDTHDSDETTIKPAEAEPIATAPPATTPVTEHATVDEVTITGCLEISTDEDRFRLTDTDGASAPKSRSWRTGFLKKRSAPVDLVGGSGTLAREKVGKRVAATGVLMTRELKVTSVRVVSQSCN